MSYILNIGNYGRSRLEFNLHVPFFSEKEKHEKFLFSKKESLDIFFDLLQTLQGLIDSFDEALADDGENRLYERELSKKSLKEKQKMLTLFRFDLDKLQPLNNKNWQEKFLVIRPWWQKLFDRLCGLEAKYDLEDVLKKFDFKIKEAFDFVDDDEHDSAKKLQKLYLFYVLRKEPERWQEIYRLIRWSNALPYDFKKEDLSLVDILVRIKSKEVREAINAEETFIREHLSELLVITKYDNETKKGLLFLSWLKSAVALYVDERFHSLWKDWYDYEIKRMLFFDKKIFVSHWSSLDDEAKKEFFREIDYDDETKKTAYRFIRNNFEDKERATYAKLFNLRGGLGDNKHLWWLPKNERLNYLKEQLKQGQENREDKRHAILFYWSEFEYDSEKEKIQRDREGKLGLMRYLDKDDELLDRPQIYELFDYFFGFLKEKEKMAAAFYASDVIKYFFNWIECLDNEQGCRELANLWNKLGHNSQEVFLLSLVYSTPFSLKKLKENFANFEKTNPVEAGWLGDFFDRFVKAIKKAMKEKGETVKED